MGGAELAVQPCFTARAERDPARTHQLLLRAVPYWPSPGAPLRGVTALSLPAWVDKSPHRSLHRTNHAKSPQHPQSILLRATTREVAPCAGKGLSTSSEESRWATFPDTWKRQMYESALSSTSTGGVVGAGVHYKSSSFHQGGSHRVPEATVTTERRL